MREFVNFAQDAVANNDKNSIARLGKKESSYASFPISAAADGDSVGKLRRSAASKRANNTVRTEFRKVVEQMFGGADKIPKNVLAAMNMKDYAKGKPLTADRILDVYAAIKEHITELKSDAFEKGTLRALDVADSVADQFVEKFKAKCRTPPSAAVVSNLKRALLLCVANSLDGNAVMSGEESVKKLTMDLDNSFNYTFKALAIKTDLHRISNMRVKELMKDEVHMRAAVFALLDKDGNVDVNNFDKRLAMFNDDWLKRYSSSTVRPNLDTPSPAAVKALQSEFVRIARVQVGDAARKEIQAIYKANPDKIPAAIRNDKREADLYVGLVQRYVTGKGESEAGARLAAGDANAKIDVASALKDFNAFMDSIYAATKGDKDLRKLVEQFSRDIAFNGAGEQRSLEDIKKKFIERAHPGEPPRAAHRGGRQRRHLQGRHGCDRPEPDEAVQERRLHQPRERREELGPGHSQVDFGVAHVIRDCQGVRGYVRAVQETDAQRELQRPVRPRRAQRLPAVLRGRRHGGARPERKGAHVHDLRHR